MLMNERIKEIRLALDMTQQEFSEKLAIKRNSLALIETGKRNVSSQVLNSICREFGVSETWLRTGEGDMFVAREADEKLAMMVGEVLADESDSFRRRLLLALTALDENDWEDLARILRKMVDAHKRDRD